MKKAALYLFAFLCTGAQAQQALSLKECIETALKNNPEVGQSAIQVQNTEMQLRQSRLNRLPTVSASIGHGINQGRSIDPFTNAYVNNQLGYGSYGIGSGVTLFSGGALINAVSRDRYGYEAAQMDLRQAKDNLAIEVILAYLTVLTYEDVLTQVKTQSELTLKQVERLELLHKDGGIPPSQLSDLRGQYAGEQLSVISTANILESSRLALCRLMNVSYTSRLSLEKVDFRATGLSGGNPEEVYASALQHFAGVKAADLRVKSAERAVDVARGQLWPTLRLGVNVNTNYSSAAIASTLTDTQTLPSADFVHIGADRYPVMRQVSQYSSDHIPYTRQLTGNFFSSFGLTLNIPVFSGLEQRNRVKSAQLSVKNNEILSATAKIRLEQAIDQASLDWQTARSRAEALEYQVAAFQESFRAAEMRFNQGVGNSIDYLTAKNNLDRANINLISAQYEAVLRAKVFDFYKGEALW